MKKLCLECSGALPGDVPVTQLYCSRACYHAARRTRIAKKQRFCAVCGTPYAPDHVGRSTRYCSRACLYKAMNTKVLCTCAHCGASMWRKPSEAEGVRFCSHACRAYALSVGKTIAVRAKERITTRQPYGTARYQKLATAVRKRDAYTCQKCGRRGEPGWDGFPVHHKIPVRLGGEDVADNLETLCPRCHRRADYALCVQDGVINARPAREKVPCACGCGTLIWATSVFGKPQRYANNHQYRGKPGRPNSPETRAKISAGSRAYFKAHPRQGHAQSPETRAKIRASHKERHRRLREEAVGGR